jgi:hypothetical protein
VRIADVPVRRLAEQEPGDADDHEHDRHGHQPADGASIQDEGPALGEECDRDRQQAARYREHRDCDGEHPSEAA